MRLRNSVAKRSSLKTYIQPEWPPLASVRGHSNLALCLLHVIACVEDIGDLFRLHINIRSEFLCNQVFGQRDFGVKFVSWSTRGTQLLWDQELGKGKVYAEFCGVYCLHNKYWGCNIMEWRVFYFHCYVIGLTTKFCVCVCVFTWTFCILAILQELKRFNSLCTEKREKV